MPVSLFMFSDHLLSHFHSEVIHANDTSRERNQRPVTSKYGSTQVLSKIVWDVFKKNQNHKKISQIYSTAKTSISPDLKK